MAPISPVQHRVLVNLLQANGRWLSWRQAGARYYPTIRRLEHIGAIECDWGNIRITAAGEQLIVPRIDAAAPA